VTAVDLDLVTALVGTDKPLDRRVHLLFSKCPDSTVIFFIVDLAGFTHDVDNDLAKSLSVGVRQIENRRARVFLHKYGCSFKELFFTFR
jgi:hypothetical protein